MSEEDQRTMAAAAIDMVTGGNMPFGFECPRGHGLRPFLTPHASFRCNDCGVAQALRTAMQGCRTCDYDVCLACTRRITEERTALMQQFS